jgi:hypothetical protein
MEFRSIHIVVIVSLVIGITIEIAVAEEQFEMEVAKSQRSNVLDDRIKLPNVPSTHD